MLLNKRHVNERQEAETKHIEIIILEIRFHRWRMNGMLSLTTSSCVYSTLLISFENAVAKNASNSKRVRILRSGLVIMYLNINGYSHE